MTVFEYKKDIAAETNLGAFLPFEILPKWLFCNTIKDSGFYEITEGFDLKRNYGYYRPNK